MRPLKEKWAGRRFWGGTLLTFIGLMLGYLLLGNSPVTGALMGVGVYFIATSHKAVYSFAFGGAAEISEPTVKQSHAVLLALIVGIWMTF